MGEKMTTFQEAQDIMFGRFKSVWDPTTYEAFYQQVREQKPDNQSPWAYVTLGSVDSRQSSLSGASGSRVFTRNSYMTIQLFVHSGKGLQLVNTLCKLLTDAFEGYSSGGVWIRNTEVSSSMRDGSFVQTNITINFTYDEVK